MNKESKQLNWFLAIFAMCAIVYSCVEVVNQGTVAPPQPVHIDVSNWPASEKSVMLLADMTLGCDIDLEFAEAIESDNIVTNDEVRYLGDLCVSRAEEEALKDKGPHALDIIRNKYENKGGLSM